MSLITLTFTAETVSFVENRFVHVHVENRFVHILVYLYLHVHVHTRKYNLQSCQKKTNLMMSFWSFSKYMYIACCCLHVFKNQFIYDACSFIPYTYSVYKLQVATCT